MPRKITTLMLKDAACLSGVARTIEKALREVPGVSHAYVNPSTEAAYVEYDSSRCNEADLAAAVGSVGIHALQPTVSVAARSSRPPIVKGGFP
jgi:copper chaperone CopZ